ncbi:heavy-metal-associated domain-containing protein [Lewinella sp. IMCC34183]|uniref:heavy-metal-associated domain-containing protein n=1 Tax=Lewinella sp. IMCC34183 TaxID=2248762 RepID=UPI000E272327|nr:heavy-metal-associated domain-containing protein [Lewinella sp. IMCC34183]
MKTYLFKTNINCGNCLRSVTPFLNENEHIKSWQVDLDSDDRILSVEGDDKLTAHDVTVSVDEAGFDAREIERA